MRARDSEFKSSCGRSAVFVSDVTNKWLLEMVIRSIEQAAVAAGGQAGCCVVTVGSFLRFFGGFLHFLELLLILLRC